MDVVFSVCIVRRGAVGATNNSSAKLLTKSTPKVFSLFV